MVCRAIGKVAAASKSRWSGMRAVRDGWGNGELGEAAASRAHHSITGGKPVHLGAGSLDDARPFHTEHGPRPALTAMHMSGGHERVCPVKTAGADPDKHLIRCRLRHGTIGEGWPIRREHDGFHGLLLKCGGEVFGKHLTKAARV
jgi:hypothetical protein